MRRYFIVATSLACLMAGNVQAQQRITVVGCVTPVDAAVATQQGPFVLTNAIPRDEARRTGGSNSPKSSTPVGGHPATATSGSSGSTTPKGSTPVRTVSLVEDSSDTVTSTTAKASVPISRKTSLSPTYELDAAPNQLAFVSGQRVEITGSVLRRSATTTPTLQVEHLRMFSATCTIQ